MRSYLPAYELIAPQSLAEALRILGSEPGAFQPFAGGTDLMVLLEFGTLAHKRFVSLWQLPELRGIREEQADVTLGALTTYTEIGRHATLQREFPMLCQAAAVTGGVAIQNRGTLAGNIANASPAADSPPALLAYDAALELASEQGTRWVPYHSFHLGYKQVALQPGEIIRSIRLPRRKGRRRHFYRKVGTRQAQAIAKVCLAATATLDEDAKHVREVRLALGSVASTVVRCPRTEELLAGQPLSERSIQQAKEQLAAEIAPIEDIRSTATYRRKVAQNLLESFLRQLMSPSRPVTGGQPA